MTSMKFVGFARVGRDEDLCQIFEDENGKLYAKNPFGSGYNWVSSGGKYKPFSGTVYDSIEKVLPKTPRPAAVPVEDYNVYDECVVEIEG